MIKEISWEEIEYIWKNYLWPNRTSPIEPNSAMNFLSGYSNHNMTTIPNFLGYYENNELVGVNSGHLCSDNSFRSRGLYVKEKYRGKSIGIQLLLKTIEIAKLYDSNLIWSFPRKTSWRTYQNAGFKLASDWTSSETSNNNAYCVLQLK